MGLKVSDRFKAKWFPALARPLLGGQRIIDKHSMALDLLVWFKL